jgi:hypothetical protein
MYEVAENLTNNKTSAIQTEWPPMSHRGPDGRIYSQYAAAPSLVSMPGVWVRNALTHKTDKDRHFWLVITSHVASACFGALTCVLFFGLCRRLGASPWAATAGTLTLAFATMVIVYARSPFSEILQTAAVLGFASALIATVDTPSRKQALYLGAWAGLVLNAKAVLALALVGGGVHLLLALRADRAALLRVLGWSLLAALPGLALFLYYNYVRWGDPLDTGYGATLSLLDEHPFNGLYGLLLSPGKSLFLYSPPLVLGVFASVRFAREHRGPARALACVGLPPLLFYACMLSWSGDWCWGPRYLTYLVPLLLVPAVISGWPSYVRSRAAAGAAAVLVVAGLGVQVLGCAFYWDHWVKIALHTRVKWLGNPDRTGATTPINSHGLCDECFEDMGGTHWMPPFSPIAGHAWLLAHRGERWAVAEKSAPWRRRTRLTMPHIETYYRQVRLDWWAFLWIDEQPAQRGVGIALLVGFLTLAVGGGIFWWRRVRAAAV